MCILGAGPPEPFAEFRLARADLVLAAEGAVDPPAGALPFVLRPEPLDGLPDDARVAVFTTGATEVHDIPDPVARLHQPGEARRARRGPRPRRGRRRRRLSHRAEGRGDRHGRDARARARAPAWCSSATGPSASTTHSSTCTAMPAPETIVVHKGHGLPVLEGADGAGDLGDRAVAGTLVRARPRDRGAARRRVDPHRRPARARGGGAPHRAGRDDRAQVRELAPARPARAPAGGAARRDDRGRQVHDRVDAGRPGSA